MSPIIDIQRRLHEEGRIRIGHQVASSNGKKRPAKLDKLRFTSQSEQAIRSIAQRYGGEAQVWADAPVGHQFEVFTDASEIPVIVPPERMAFSLWYETWSAGGCRHRCDGEWDTVGEAPCACDPDNRECRPHARLSVMLADHPGSGLWRVDTSSFYASSELAGAFELAQVLVQATGRSVLAAKLRLQQRQVRRPDPENQGTVVTRNFPVVVLDFDYDIGAIALGRGTHVELGTGTGDRPALTPIQHDESAAPSIEAQVAAVRDAQSKPPRANAQAALPPSGRQRGRMPAANAETGEIVDAETATPEQVETFKTAAKASGITTAVAVRTFVNETLGRNTVGWSDLTSEDIDALMTALSPAGDEVSA